MINVTRLDGSHFVVNADLIETVERTAGTVISLTDGKRYVVATPVQEIVDRVVAYRQRIARGALVVVDTLDHDLPDGPGGRRLAMVQFDQPSTTPTPFRRDSSNGREG